MGVLFLEFAVLAASWFASFNTGMKDGPSATDSAPVVHILPLQTDLLHVDY